MGVCIYFRVVVQWFVTKTKGLNVLTELDLLLTYYEQEIENGAYHNHDDVYRIFKVLVRDLVKEKA